VAGDVMVAAVGIRGTPTVTPPSGWTLIRRDQASTYTTQALYARVVTAAEPASYVWVFSQPVPAAGGIVAYQGVNTATPVGGVLTPYYENNDKVVKCPLVRDPPLRLVYGGNTGGYAYNRYTYDASYGPPPNYALIVKARPMSYFESTSTTVLFTDSAFLTDSGGWHMEEAVMVTGPVAFQTSYIGYGYYLNFTQFRHTNTANVAFLDGHVEALTEVPVATPAGWDANVDAFRKKYSLGFPFATETPYNGKY